MHEQSEDLYALGSLLGRIAPRPSRPQLRCALARISPGYALLKT
jgi:hypothetical protein